MTPENLERAIRRAIEADELDDDDIALELGCCREHVCRIRSRMRAERRDQIAAAADRRRAR